MKMIKSTGIAAAMAAATLFATAPMTATAAESNGAKADVHCYGVNKCKGHNDCGTAQNACAGHGKCKGQGFVAMSKHACDAIGGKAKAK